MTIFLSVYKGKANFWIKQITKGKFMILKFKFAILHLQIK